MNVNVKLSDIAALFMALADETRLRLLNLMRDGEVCVCFFTEALGLSQPKVSRHLAYLRNAGIVGARRDGKWMHYRIIRPDDKGQQNVLDEVLHWLADRNDMQADREKFLHLCRSPEMLVQIARTPIDFISPEADMYGGDVPTGNDAAHNEIEEFLL